MLWEGRPLPALWGRKDVTVLTFSHLKSFRSKIEIMYISQQDSCVPNTSPPERRCTYVVWLLQWKRSDQSTIRQRTLNWLWPSCRHEAGFNTTTIQHFKSTNRHETNGNKETSYFFVIDLQLLWYWEYDRLSGISDNTCFFGVFFSTCNHLFVWVATVPITS